MQAGTVAGTVLTTQQWGVDVGDKSGGGTPGPIPNPAVKPTSADGSLGLAHARVGHRQHQPPCFLLSTRETLGGPRAGSTGVASPRTSLHLQSHDIFITAAHLLFKQAKVGLTGSVWRDNMYSCALEIRGSAASRLQVGNAAKAQKQKCTASAGFDKCERVG